MESNDRLHLEYDKEISNIIPFDSGNHITLIIFYIVNEKIRIYLQINLNKNFMFKSYS